MFNFLIYLNIGILCTLIIVNFVAPHLDVTTFMYEEW